MTQEDLLPAIKRIHALAQTGLGYTNSEYDRERYEEIQSVSLRILAEMGNVSIANMMTLLPQEIGYITPKVDIRGVVFNGRDQILLVQEKIDNNRWTVPGGWADIGYTPFEVAEKELLEETGLIVKATRLLAVFDTKRHDHPKEPWYVYKFFVLCEVTGGSLAQQTTETSGASWINFKDIASLPLSIYRVTLAQLDMILNFASNPESPVICD